MEKIMIIVVGGEKGGTGKTTIAVNLSRASRRTAAPTSNRSQMGQRGSKPVLLQEPQPHLARRRIGRYGVPQLVERDLADDGDRGRVHEV